VLNIACHSDLKIYNQKIICILDKRLYKKCTPPTKNLITLDLQHGMTESKGGDLINDECVNISQCNQRIGKNYSALHNLVTCNRHEFLLNSYI